MRARTAASIIVSLLALAASLPAWSGDREARIARDLHAVEGQQRVEVDVELLVMAAEGGDAARELARLRLHDGAREVPYLLVAPAAGDELWRGGEILPVLATKKTSGFEVDMGSLARYDRVRLAGIRAPFLKRMRLEASGDRERWWLLVAEGTLFDLPDEGLRALELSFPAGDIHYFRVTWDDTNSGVVAAPTRFEARDAARPTPAPPLLSPVEFTRRPSEPGKSRFSVTLPAAHLPIQALELSCSERRLLRPARVTEARLQNFEVHPVDLGGATLRRVEADGAVAADLRIPVGRPLGPDLELVVDDGDNPPFELAAVRMELAPQPFIYLEIQAPATLEATIGEGPAPRYDLEALRGRLDVTDLPEATWGPPRQDTRASTRPGLPELAGGAIQGVFLYERTLPARGLDTPPGAIEALRLDAAALAHTRRDLGDVRVADGDGRQVPYLLERLGEPLPVELGTPAPLPADGARPTVSRYRLALPYAQLPPGTLVVETEARVFRRDVRIMATHDGHPYVVTSATWAHGEPERAAPPLSMALPSLSEKDLVLEIDEGDNQALRLGAMRLLLPSQRIRFPRTSDGPLRLLYGDTALTAPRYDLALLAPRLVGVPTVEIDAGAEEPTRAAAVADRPRIIFWASLVLAVIVLLGLMARLMRDGR